MSIEVKGQRIHFNKSFIREHVWYRITDYRDEVHTRGLPTSDGAQHIWREDVQETASCDQELRLPTYLEKWIF